MQNHVQREKLLESSFIFSFFTSKIWPSNDQKKKYNWSAVKRSDQAHLFHWLVTVALQVAELQAPLLPYKENRNNVKCYRGRIYSLLGKGSTRTSMVSIAEIIQSWREKIQLMPFHKTPNTHSTQDPRKYHPLWGEGGFSYSCHQQLNFILQPLNNVVLNFLHYLCLCVVYSLQCLPGKLFRAVTFPKAIN